MSTTQMEVAQLAADRLTIGSRLRSARDRSNLTGQQVATALSGIHPSLATTKASVSAWELGRNLPDAITLRELAKLFGVTVDELIAPSEDSLPAPDFSRFSSRLLWARTRAGLSQAQLASRAGMSASAIAMYESESRDAPRDPFALADALGVCARWLVTSQGSPDGEGPLPDPPIVRAIAERLRSLPDEKVLAVASLLDVRLKGFEA